MPKWFLIITFLILSQTVKLQSVQEVTIAPNTFYFELLGNNLEYSINYDHILNYRLKYLSGYKISFTPFLFNKISSGRYVASAGFYRLYGRANKFLELGSGITYFFGIERNKYQLAGPYFNIGYRKQGVFSKPFFFRATATPFLLFDMVNLKIVGPGMIGPWLGVSFGYSFRKRNQD